MSDITNRELAYYLAVQFNNMRAMAGYMNAASRTESAYFKHQIASTSDLLDSLEKRFEFPTTEPTS